MSITATARHDGTGTLHVDGVDHQVRTGSLAEARAAILRLAADEARKAGKPLRVIAREPDGEWPVLITPDGTVTPDDHPEAVGHGGEAGDGAGPAAVPATHGAGAPDRRRSGPAWPPTGVTSPAVPARPVGPSFLPEPATIAEPRTGWRGLLHRLGITVTPSPAELAHRDDIADVSQHWPGTRTIVVANGKGGSNKTPTVILLSAVLARYGGGGVVAWGNHQMRGTLGWRTVPATHDATTRDLISAASSFGEAGGRVGDLARYVHHQPADKFDVLRNSPEITADIERIDHRGVSNLHQVLAKYYRVIVIDSDNDESGPHWRQMMRHADQLVVATTTEDVAAEAGRLMLDSLADRGGREARLAEQAVVIVSQAAREDTTAADVAAKFGRRGLDTATLPYDPGMRRLRLAYDQLHPDTQRAALHAAAVVARRL